MMTPEYIQTLRRLMEFEASRTEPPAGFPALPDIPAGRYTDPRYYELERKHIWRKSWLLAAHIDEIPEPGCYMLWENAGHNQWLSFMLTAARSMLFTTPAATEAHRWSLKTAENPVA